MSLFNFIKNEQLTAPELRTIILEAATVLLKQCDGAITRDMAGFNGHDSKLVQSILSHRFISDKQILLLQKRLVKYKRTQLPDLGIDVQKLFSVPYKPLLPKKKLTKTTLKTEYISLSLVDDQIQIKSPYNEKLIKWIKTKKNRSYQPETKTWLISIDLFDALKTVIENLVPPKAWIKYKIVIDPTIEKEIVRVQDIKKRSNLSTSTFDVPGLGGTLYPFQKAAVQFIELTKGRTLLADEMGLGKSVEMLAYIQLHKFKKVLLVVPASLKINWHQEAKKWLSYTSNIQIIKTGKLVPLTGTLIIINYDILKKWKEILISHNFDIIVLDESHLTKNGKSQRSIATKEIAGSIEKIVMLTGTPILNRPIELWNQLQILNPKKYNQKNFFKFAYAYCDPKKVRISRTKFVTDFTGASNTQALNDELKTLMIRRKKEDVLKELPNKQITVFSLPILERVHQQDIKRLNKLYSTLSRESDEEGNASFLTLIEQMKQAAVQGKMKAAFEWINNFLETGEKIVLFATHQKTVDDIMNKFPKIAVKLTGSCSQDERQKAVDQFQKNPNIKIFIGNIKAAGVGITLTASSTVAFLELSWTPGDHMQSADRCHRIGQSNAVNIYYLIADDTIETKIVKLLQDKAKVVDSVIDGTTAASLSIYTELKKLLEESIK